MGVIRIRNSKGDDTELTDKGRTDMVSGKSLIMSLRLPLHRRSLILLVHYAGMDQYN